MRLPSIALKLPWSTIVNYGLIDHQIVKYIALSALQKAHPDKKDIALKDLDIITATNLTESYFFVCSKQTTPNMSAIDAVLIPVVGISP